MNIYIFTRTLQMKVYKVHVSNCRGHMIASDAYGKRAYYRSQSHCSGRSNGFSIRMTRPHIDALRKIVSLIIIILYNCIMDRDINFRSFEPATPRQMINISRGMRKKPNAGIAGIRRYVDVFACNYAQ